MKKAKKQSFYSKTFILKIYDTKTDNFEVEGIFDSIKEISKYLNISKPIATKIFNCRYEGIDKIYETIAIHQEYSSEEYMAELNDFRNGKLEDEEENVA